MQNKLRMAYIVKEGETLAELFCRFGVERVAFNEMNPGVTEAVPGQQVWIPVLWRICPNGLLYPLKRGDTLASAGQRFGLTLYEVLSLNPYLAPWACRPGQVIVVKNRLMEKKYGE